MMKNNDDRNDGMTFAQIVLASFNRPVCAIGGSLGILSGHERRQVVGNRKDNGGL